MKGKTPKPVRKDPMPFPRGMTQELWWDNDAIRVEMARIAGTAAYNMFFGVLVNSMPISMSTDPHGMIRDLGRMQGWREVLDLMETLIMPKSESIDFQPTETITTTTIPHERDPRLQL